MICRGFDDVRFLEEVENRSNPDLTFLVKSHLYCCEVKTLGISNDEINRRKDNFSVLDDTDYERLSEEFLSNKFSNAISEAKQQINRFGTKGLIYIIINFDDFTLDHYQTYRKQLVSYSKDKKYENLFIKIGLSGNRRIFIDERPHGLKTNP